LLFFSGQFRFQFFTEEIVEESSDNSDEGELCQGFYSRCDGSSHDVRVLINPITTQAIEILSRQNLMIATAEIKPVSKVAKNSISSLIVQAPKLARESLEKPLTRS